jgi:hypothetical protein
MPATKLATRQPGTVSPKLIPKLKKVRSVAAMSYPRTFRDPRSGRYTGQDCLHG